MGGISHYEHLKIIYVPDKRLKKVCHKVQIFEKSILSNLTTRMLRLMKMNNGVGLAAPQVGIALNIFVANLTGENLDDRVYINPILTFGEIEEESVEGCLSIPGVRLNIKRKKHAQITAQDLSGNTFTESADGTLARIWQHENDHLMGILISDRYVKKEQS
jgi:peptide deformylase